MIYIIQDCKIGITGRIIKGGNMEKNYISKENGKKIAVFVLALIGFITTIKLAIIYYDANFNPYALSSFCSINEFIDCDGIAKTTESQFWGIPLAYWGMFLYAFMFLMLFVDKLKNIKFLKFLEVFKHPLDYIAMLGLISFVISMILLFLSLFEIKKLCVLCAFTYILNLLIGIIATDFQNGGFVQSFKNSVGDFLDAIKNKAYLAAFISVMLIAGGFLYWTATSYKFAPQVKRQQQFKEFFATKHNKYAVSGNILGDKDAKLKVHVYSDYMCPICSAYNIMIHKLAKELKGVEFVHHDLPLDMECNKYLIRPFHNGSCQMAKYALAAKKQGKLWDINSAFFEKKPQTSEEILEIAKELGLNTDELQKVANSDEVSQLIKKEIDNSYSQKIDATPAMKIGDEVIVGLKPYDEMKAIMIKHGASRK